MKKLCVAVIIFLSGYSVFAQSRFPASEIDPSQIDIVRDAYGVPHIFAKTDPEVAYGLAWAHAEDDFETIQKCFLAAKGMLGLTLGREGATVDYVVYLLRIRELVEQGFQDDISDQYKSVLQGYCDGFNAYAESHPKEVLEKKSFPITPQDVLTYSVLQLAMGCGVESALKEILDGTVELAEWSPAGSNGFAFNSKKTADGNVYLAINTHHPLQGQVAWYEVHLSSEEGWNILGSLFPGSPVIFTGVNEYLGWTHTVNHPDKLDIYQLEMNPENELQYLVDGTWHTLEETTVKLKMKVPGINLHIRKKAYWSIYGPTLITSKGVFSIRTGGIMDIRGLEQWYWMNKARTFSEFRNVLEMQALPSYNLIYGDRYDTIYYLSNAKIPFRQPGFDWTGTLPGNTSQTLWTKFHPLEDLPQVLNPSSGYVYNANHSPFNATGGADNLHEADFDPTMGYETHDNNRSLRVMELMQQYDKVSFEDFKNIKYDLQLPRKLAYPVNIDTIFLLDENAYPEYSDLIGALNRWDRKAVADSHGAAVFAVFFYYVADLYRSDKTLTALTTDGCLEALSYVKNYMLKNFGTTDIRLGDYQRLERGDKSLPLWGIPGVLSTMYSTPSDNGRVKGTIGDCYIALIKFTHNGPEIETVNAFGASNHEGSIHYDDQMELFQQQRTKPMTLDRDLVYRDAKTIYHPEVLSKLPLTARLNRGRR